MKKIIYVLFAIAVLARLMPDDQTATPPPVETTDSARDKWIASETFDLRLLARSNTYKDSDRYEVIAPHVTDLGDEVYIVARYKEAKTGRIVGYRGHYDATTRKRLSLTDIQI
jgi:hypothetical protein